MAWRETNKMDQRLRLFYDYALPERPHSDRLDREGPLRKLKTHSSDSLRCRLTRNLRDERAYSTLPPLAGRGEGGAICDYPPLQGDVRQP